MTKEKAFTMVELIAVVALIAILGTGALVGISRSREAANLQKVLQQLNAIDLAKQTWGNFHRDASLWPVTEPDRWTAIKDYLGTTVNAGSALGNNFFYYEGFTPSSQFGYQIGALGDPSQATNTAGTNIVRSL